jgi:hypothetical protein
MPSSQWVEQVPGGGPAMALAYIAESDGVLVDVLDAAEATHMEVLLEDGTVGVVPYVAGHTVDAAIGALVLSVRTGDAPVIAVSDAAPEIDAVDPVAPAPVVVDVTNDGALSLPDLSASVEHLTGATGWLSADLSAPLAPCTLTLTADTATIYDGTHTARVTLTSEWATPRTVMVTLTVEPSTVPLGDETFARASSATYTELEA